MNHKHECSLKIKNQIQENSSLQDGKLKSITRKKTLILEKYGTKRHSSLRKQAEDRDKAELIELI